MLKLWITIKEVILMKNYIPTPTISEMLKEEFMEPLGLTAYRLAKDIKVPVSRIQEILYDKRRITADTDLRLCKYFGMSNGFFLKVQMDLDLREAQTNSRLLEALQSIQRCTAIPVDDIKQ